MRPGDFSPGNVEGKHRMRSLSGFNEAGGFLPRKRRGARSSPRATSRFNEAGGFLPRKPANQPYLRRRFLQLQ